MSHTYTSNAAEIGQHFVDQIKSFGFTTDYTGRALGELIIDNVVEGIIDRTVNQQLKADGSPLPPNSDNPPGHGYKSRKMKKYGAELTNVRTGQMMQAKALRGKNTRITQHLVTIEYGWGDYPEGANASDADKMTADTTKAAYAAKQGREFYQLDQKICDENFKSFSEALGAHIANRGR